MDGVTFVRYAFTGPSKLTASQQNTARDAVRALRTPTDITTGAAHGWDTVCALEALTVWPEARHRIVTPGARYNVGGVERCLDIAAVHDIDLVVIQCGGGTIPADAYRRRNEIMVGHSDTLVAGLLQPTFYRSGEWMTVNIARRAGVSVHVVPLTPA
jgi:hypothetical protein